MKPPCTAYQNGLNQTKKELRHEAGRFHFMGVFVLEVSLKKANKYIFGLYEVVKQTLYTIMCLSFISKIIQLN